MEEEINNFIKNLHILEMINNATEALFYIAKNDNYKELDEFFKMHNLIDDANKNLLSTIYNALENKEYSKNNDVNFLQNFSHALEIIKNISAQIPNKDELVSMIEACKKNFTSEKISAIFFAITKDPILFSKQILFLSEICHPLAHK